MSQTSEHDISRCVLPGETSLSFLVLGAALVFSLIPQFARALRYHLIFGLLGNNWTAGLLIAVAFAVIWIAFRYCAARRRTSAAAGFGTAALIALVICLPPLAIAVALGARTLSSGRVSWQLELSSTIILSKHGQYLQEQLVFLKASSESRTVCHFRCTEAGNIAQSYWLLGCLHSW